MSNEMSENFRQLFDTSNNGDDTDADQLMTKQAEEGFESVPRDDNFDKFEEIMRSSKEDVEKTKVLFVPAEEEQEDVTPDVEVTSVEEVKKVIQDSVSIPKKEIEEEGIVEEDVEDSNSNDANVFETDSAESEESVIMDLPETDTVDTIPNTWHFTSPLPKFNNFYEEKKKLVSMIVGNNPLPFEHWMNDLKDAKIDVADLQYDPKILCQTMVRIHEWRDRVQSMLISVNGQYFLWHRFVDLLRGLLAQVAYEKPVDKFKGIVYRHMGDVEMYFAKLEGLREDIDGVMKNLDGATSLASRHLTILMATKQMPVRYKDAYEEVPQIKEEHIDVEPEKKEAVEPSKLCKEFDSLHDKGVSGPEIKQEPQLAKVPAWD